MTVYAARSYRRGRLLRPSRLWLLRHLLPGLVLALVAIGIFTGLETVDNYQVGGGRDRHGPDASWW